MITFIENHERRRINNPFNLDKNYPKNFSSSDNDSEAFVAIIQVKTDYYVCMLKCKIFAHIDKKVSSEAHNDDNWMPFSDKN